MRRSYLPSWRAASVPASAALVSLTIAALAVDARLLEAGRRLTHGWVVTAFSDVLVLSLTVLVGVGAANLVAGRTLVVAAAVRRALSTPDLLPDLRRAIAGNGLELHYQPKLNVRSGTIDSLEALVRWTHPQRGAISPGEFIPLAEESGDIRALTIWVFDAACRASNTLHGHGLGQPIFVNVSALLIADENFVSDLIAKATATGAKIGIEVTETACLQQPQRALANLQRMASAGLSVAIDDYGVGLSSLTYLRQMPASELKIDMSFIRDLSVSHRDPMIVRSTIDLAHGLGLKVTAEGVDKPEILALLTIMGCDYVQGFYIAPPFALSTCIDFILKGYSQQLQLPDYADDLRRYIKPKVVQA